MPKGFSGGGPKGFSGGGGGFSGGSKGFSGGGNRPSPHSSHGPRPPVHRGGGGSFLGGMVLGQMLGRSSNGSNGDGNNGDNNENDNMNKEPEKPTKKRCNYCGTETKIETEKCENCGSSEFTVIQPEPESGSVKSAPVKSPEEIKAEAERIKKSNRTKLWVTLAAVVLLIVIIVVSTKACSAINIDKKFEAYTPVQTAFFQMTVTDILTTEGTFVDETDPYKQSYYAAKNNVLYIVTVLIYNNTSYNAPFSDEEDFMLYSESKKSKGETISTNEYTINAGESRSCVIVFEISKSKASELYFIYIEYDPNGYEGDTYGIRLN
ncbi:MAG: DUF4352 domain-containing protein [Clostridiales bacterium]|jgi:hypothetical protein|nr:DUF4352 domain-containing protein [Clostridiales bacterium]